MNPAAARFLPPSWRRGWVFGLLLFLITLVAFGPALGAGYIWDDDMFLTQNPLLTASDGLRRIWFSFDSPSQYFPLTYTSFYIERHLWGLNPAGYHLVNILLHATTVVLVWLLLTRLRVPSAWLAAAIFGIHPLQVESVAWVAERKNVLMGVFFILTLLEWAKFIDSREKPVNYVLSLLFYALSLTAKTTACTLPAALFLILWIKKIPIDRKRILQILPFVGMALIMALLSVCWEHRNPGFEGQKLNIGLLERPLIASRALWFYMGKLFWPAHLTVDYPRWNVSASNPADYAWLAGIILLTVAVWYVRRWTGRAVETGLLFFVLTLGPMLGFVMHYMYVYSFVADHFQYLACLGLIGLATTGLALAGQRIKMPWLEPGCGFVIIAALGTLTWMQCELYADPGTLWQATLRINPESWVAEGSLGTLAFDAGQMDEAVAHFKKGLLINPNFSELHYDLGRTYLQMGRMDDAAVEYKDELRIFPKNIDALGNLGYIFLKAGKLDEAIAKFEAALKVDPHYAPAHDNLGEALLKKGDLDDAIAQLEEADRLEPRYTGEQDHLAIALAKKGRYNDAVSHFKKALQLNPNDTEAAADFAWLLATCPDIGFRNGNQALLLARKATEMQEANNASILQIVAAAEAQSGDFKSALATSKTALNLTIEQNNSALEQELRREMELYKSSQPERDMNGRWGW